MVFETVGCENEGNMQRCDTCVFQSDLLKCFLFRNKQKRCVIQMDRMKEET